MLRLCIQFVDFIAFVLCASGSLGESALQILFGLVR